MTYHLARAHERIDGVDLSGANLSGAVSPCARTREDRQTVLTPYLPREPGITLRARTRG